MSKGWCWPTGTSNIGNYIGWLDSNPNPKYLGKMHLGQDIDANEDDPVYAIADGKVIENRMDVSDYGGVGYPGGALIIEHTDDNNKPFTVIYGHLKNIDVGCKVVRGQKIAKIGEYKGGSDHLHFGLRYPANTGSGLWAGYTTSGKKGFVDPLGFLSKHSPKREFVYIWEPARMFFDEDDYGIGWWPKDVTCVNAEMWTENQKIIEDADNSMCEKGFNTLSERYFFGMMDEYGFVKMWNEAFFGDEMNIDTLQCIAR